MSVTLSAITLVPASASAIDLNAVADRGEGYAQFSRLERTLLSLALDFRVTEDTRVELDGSRYHYVDLGYPGTFAVASNVRFRALPIPRR